MLINVVEKRGNIFTTSTRVMAHGVNLQDCEDHGLAAQVWEKFPEVFDTYEYFRDSGLLTPGSAFAATTEASDGKDFTVFNLASQILPGRNARYDLLESSLDETFYILRESGIKSIAFPEIGSGIGGLDAELVDLMITQQALRNPDILIEKWKYEK